MWKPPQRIKHALPELQWPTQVKASGSRLFSPIAIGNNLSLSERTWVPAMVPWRATEEGEVTDALIEWYSRFAQGQPGAIVVEATGIRDIPSGPLLRIGHDRFIGGLKRLVSAVKEHSKGRSKVFIQLIDFLRIRRRPSRDKYLTTFLQITHKHSENLAKLTGNEGLELSEAEIRAALLQGDDAFVQAVLTPREFESLQFGMRERVTDTEQPHIAELPKMLPELFASAACRAQEAGFDGVELHYAHAYTMASFLSKLNVRTDGYGGDRSHRIRLPLEVYSAVRSRVSPQFVVGCRYLCDEIIEGGNSVDDATWFGVEFARAGMDFLSLSTGGKFEDAKQPKPGWAAYPYTGQSGYECMPTTTSDERGPFGRNIPKQSTIRAAIRAAGYNTPVVVAGGIHSFEQAESILQQGHGDIVAAARQTLADPDWFLKARTGHGNSVRQCLYTNYCEALDQKHKQVTCQLWDRDALDEPGALMSWDGKRRLTAPAWKPPT